MAGRYIALRKRLIKESIMLAIVVAAFAAAGFVLENYSEDAQSEQRIKEDEVNATRAKLTQIRQELEDGQAQVILYNKYIKHHNEDFSLNRENATKWIVKQRDPLHLVNLSITVPPFTEVAKDMFPLKSGTMIKSDVKVTFSALTDNSVFAFIEKLQKEMPGVVVMQDLKITRTADISSTVILELNNHRITPLVTAEISFAWFGLRSDAKDKTNAK